GSGRCGGRPRNGHLRGPAPAQRPTAIQESFMKVAWAQEAQERLQEIEDFISRNSPEMAVRLIEKLLERGDRLASFPRAGRRVPELDSQDIREVIEGNYRIVY